MRREGNRGHQRFFVALATLQRLVDRGNGFRNLPGTAESFGELGNVQDVTPGEASP